MTYRDHEGIEFLPPDAIRPVQEVLLREHLRYCVERSPFYRHRLATVRGRIGEMTLPDLQRLPLTDKHDLARENDAFLAVPRHAAVDIVLSSGTSGVPTRILYTDGDLQRLAYNEKQSFLAMGMTRDDTVLLTCTMDRCFVAGLAYFLGVRAVGAAAVRNGLASIESHRELILRTRPTLIVGVPSFLRKLGMSLAENGDEPCRSGVRGLIGIGEPVRDRELAPLPVAVDLGRLWGAPVYSTYASSEIVTTFCECTALAGGHLHPELGVLEIVDDAGRPLPPGEVGEVVVTPLGVEGMPLVRFRTGDLSFLIPDPCRCGRHSPRLGPVLARRNQMMKLKGTTFYPQAIAAALSALPGVVEHYVEVLAADTLSDRVIVHVCVSDPTLDAGWIRDRLQARLRVTPEVRIESEDTVRRQVFNPNFRKPMRFVDRRSP